LEWVQKVVDITGSQATTSAHTPHQPLNSGPQPPALPTTYTNLTLYNMSEEKVEKPAVYPEAPKDCKGDQDGSNLGGESKRRGS